MKKRELQNTFYRDFFIACETVQKEYSRRKQYISASRIAQKAILYPAGSFYLGKNRILTIINSENLSLAPAKKSTQMQNREIIDRYKNYIRQGLSKRSAIDKIIRDKAPRFYIEEKTAARIYYKILKKQIPIRNEI